MVNEVKKKTVKCLKIASLVAMHFGFSVAAFERLIQEDKLLRIVLVHTSQDGARYTERVSQIAMKLLLGLFLPCRLKRHD